MIAIDHHTSTDLSPMEKRELLARQRAKSQFVSEALNALRVLTSKKGASSHAVRHAVATLEQEPHTAVPRRDIEGRSTSASTSRSPAATEAPHSTSRSTSSGIRRSMRNEPFARRLALREEVNEFSIPVNRPLPLSYDAQRDRRLLQGDARRHSQHPPSDYAPLFSRSARPMSAKDRERLGFLTPPKDSPKERTLKVLEERHQYDRPCEPNAKSLYNEPKQLPNLHQKVDSNFVPECAHKLTVSTGRRRRGSAAQSRRASVRMVWR